MTKAVYDKVGNVFKTTKPNANHNAHVNGQKKSAGKGGSASPALPIPITPVSSAAMRNSQAHQANAQKIEVSIPARKLDLSSYVDARESPPVPAPRPLAAPRPAPEITPPDRQLQPSPSKPMVQNPIAPTQPPQTPESKSSQDARGRMFQIELSAKNIDRSEYLEVTQIPNQPRGLSVRRLGPVNAGGQVLGDSLDQRQRGDAALDALDKLFRSIQSAAGHALAGDNAYSHIVCLTPALEPTMTAGTQQKLHTSLHKAIDLKCFEQVPIENLVTVMKLSDNLLKHGKELEISVDENWDDSALAHWLGQLFTLEAALKGARTCIRVLSGGREDRQLYSEGLIKRTVNLFKAVTEDLVIPIVELRHTGPSASLFKMLGRNKKTITTIFSCFQKLFSLLAELITKIELSEEIINTLEYTASRLIFVENAHIEKDSAIGIQKFDGIRSTAMDMLCQVFLVKPGQRAGIIDDILTSLEKLPVGKQSSRQFKLSDGGSIQPVSALIMRLIQASSRKVDMTSRSRPFQDVDEDGEWDGRQQQLRTTQPKASTRSEDQGAQHHGTAIQDLHAVAGPLRDTALGNANYVINFIVSRAMRSSKTGDTPYRNLLDLFVDDFTTCVDSSDWPAAELLLRVLMITMMQHFEAPKTAAPTKAMALELFGNMSSAISRLRFHVKKLATSFEIGDQDELSSYLSDLASHVLEQRGDMEHVVGWSGPFRTTLESLQARASDDPHVSNAMSLLAVEWAARTHALYESFETADDDRDQELGRLAYRLRMIIDDRKWLASEWSYTTVGSGQANLAHAIVLLRSPLCEAYDKIFRLLLLSMDSDQITVRNKSLKSVSQILETDPSILDGNSSVMEQILERVHDSSVQVRDSALGLSGTCFGMRPALGARHVKAVIARFADSGPGVRKRAMKIAKDIYLRNNDRPLRSAVANGVLRRVQDPDESVRELARLVIEEIWFAPFYKDDETAQYQTSLADHVTLIIQTVNTGGALGSILDKVFQAILKPGIRSFEGPLNVCKKIVASMFGLINNLDPEDSTAPSGRDALAVLTIFAKADPRLFSFEQIRLLKPHLSAPNGPKETAAFRSVTVIYRLVLPQLPSAHSEFVAEIRQLLQTAMGRTRERGLMDDLVACTRVCCDILQNMAPLANAAASSLLGISKLPTKTKLPQQALMQFKMYSLIIGIIAKHCDLDGQKALFKQKFQQREFDKVTRLVVDVLSPFLSSSQDSAVRMACYEAMGLVCEASPRCYSLPKVYTAFQQVFQDDEAALQSPVLRSFKEFLFTEERRSETGAAEDGQGEKKKELTVMGGTTFDDVASALAQRFLKDITRIALSSQDEHSFEAMEVLGSINRQGLTHPKETGVTLITLETSSNSRIAELAYAEHRSLHEKHETVLEREYVKALQLAYTYQRDIVKDPHGARTDPFESKLHLLMQVLKISKLKNRQRFLEKMCGQADFELAKLEDEHVAMHQLGFSRFIVENLAYFEYQAVGELQSIVGAIEKIVALTGAAVAQAIESDVFQVRMDVGQLELTPQLPGAEGEAPSALPMPQVEPARLRQLVTAAIILLSMWDVRTYLRRLYGMGTNRHDSKAKALAKDLNKNPTKVQGIHGDKIWEDLLAHLNAFDSPEAMVHKCRALVELMSVDKEFKVIEEDEMGLDGPTTPSGEEDGDEDGDGRGRKRKASSTPGGRKKIARSSSQTRKRGRPRKNPVAEQEADSDAEADWF